ncbi:MAG: methionine biosynthesis protein MetW [Gammaproteobacteria bacterium]|nr:methionine biosynthesis protein MetW [Gammaproteobacteria bacterium]NND40411.1 methionine biosynthesis protein MetW [Pseudomonadales bacterium]MBT8151885.1 methionine biosynthesis protein MetW [Gammaproteobacteria bacterium]NNL10379.1 methionine biosynthesis protein MetW [Pseudomonadales bacterium]NNM11117.1 methionine biosynthesis protein MetW [Pseudomonadales bacterium]
MRSDFLAIEEWVSNGSRVLDIGCGDGALLQHLQANRQVRGLGVEIDETKILDCVAKGIEVIEQNADQGMANFADNSFDTVLLTQTLQAVHRPDFVLEEMLRIGKECVITFPNFGHWQARRYLLWRGKMPVSKFMPYKWYDTPNIHFCTVRDFEQLCAERNISVLHRSFESRSTGDSHRSALVDRWPNLLATHALYHVTR